MLFDEKVIKDVEKVQLFLTCYHNSRTFSLHTDHEACSCHLIHERVIFGVHVLSHRYYDPKQIIEAIKRIESTGGTTAVG